MTGIPLVYKRSRKLGAAPFNITIIQVYAPTSGHDDSEVDHFYQQLQETIDQTPKKDIQAVQEEWNDKVGKDAQADWVDVCGPYCNIETNESGLRLLEFATFNNLVLTNTLCTAKMGSTTARLNTSWWRGASDQELTSIGQGAFLELT